MDVRQGTPPTYITPPIALDVLGTDSRAAVQLSCDTSETDPLLDQSILTEQGILMVKAKEFSLVLLSGGSRFEQLTPPVFRRRPRPSAIARYRPRCESAAHRACLAPCPIPVPTVPLGLPTRRAPHLTRD